MRCELLSVYTLGFPCASLTNAQVVDLRSLHIVDSQRLLGGVIESDSGRKTFVEELMKKWIAKLECLTMIAATQPQAAFAAFTKSLQFQFYQP